MKGNNSTGSVCNRGELSGGTDQARCGGKQNGRQNYRHPGKGGGMIDCMLCNVSFENVSLI